MHGHDGNRKFDLTAHTLCCTIETAVRELKGQTPEKSAYVTLQVNRSENKTLNKKLQNWNKN